MLTPEEHRRYHRHLIMPEIGMTGQLRLKDACVLVIGAGGLGCPVLQYLAAAGVGKIGVVDHDTVSESNLQRQVLYSAADTGKLKALVAAEKISAQNPFILVDPTSGRISAENALELINPYDIVIDCSDNFSTRYLLNDACVILGKPLVSGAIFKFEAQISVFNYRQGPTYRCLYPEPGELPSCAEAGVMGVLPGVAGCLMANEVIKIVTGQGNVLSGKLLTMDLLSMQMNTFSFIADPINRNIETLADTREYCSTDIIPLTSSALKEMMRLGEAFELIDVREPDEHRAANIGGRNIPLSLLESKLHTIPGDTKVVVHCAGGNRSRRAAEILIQHGHEKVYNLEKGLTDF